MIQSTSALSVPLVTVAVPVYMHERYIDQCLASIAAQDHERIELIVVDDGSTDQSVALVERFLQSQHARFERSEFITRPNKGLVATFNELVELATGEYFVPLASDDLLLPGAISQRLSILQSRPGVSAVFTDCNVIAEDGSVVAESAIRDLHGGSRWALSYRHGLATSLTLRWCVPGPGLMVRRRVLDELGGYSPDRFPEDFDFYLRLAATDQLIFDQRATAGYRRHGTSLTATKAADLLKGTTETLRALKPGMRPTQKAAAQLLISARSTTIGRARRLTARAGLKAMRAGWTVWAATLGWISIRREAGR